MGGTETDSHLHKQSISNKDVKLIQWTDDHLSPFTKIFLKFKECLRMKIKSLMAKFTLCIFLIEINIVNWN